MERARQPGLTLGLTDRDGTLLIRTYGFADLASRQPVTPDTLFEIGSIGKTFTAVAILQLVDEGRIDLHAPVARYLPWFAVPQPAGHAPITIAHLLSHTAGIVAGIDGTPEAAFQVWSLRDLPTRSPRRVSASTIPTSATRRSGSCWKRSRAARIARSFVLAFSIRSRCPRPSPRSRTTSALGWPWATSICTTTG